MQLCRNVKGLCSDFCAPCDNIVEYAANRLHCPIRQCRKAVYHSLYEIISLLFHYGRWAVDSEKALDPVKDSSAFWTWLVNVVTNVTQWGINLLSVATSAVTNTINNIVSLFQGLPGKVWTWLVNVVNKVTEWGINLRNQAVSAVTVTTLLIIVWTAVFACDCRFTPHCIIRVTISVSHVHICPGNAEIAVTTVLTNSVAMLRACAAISAPHVIILSSTPKVRW